MKESLEAGERPDNRPRRCCEGGTVGRKSGRGPSGASNGVPGESATTMGVREEQRRRRDPPRGGRECETIHEDEERRREWERESILEPPLLACRALMNANHDPEAARSTCCFPVQIAYNFYCHGRNSSLMEARLIAVLVLRPSRVSCVLLPSLQLSHHRPPCFTLAVGFSL